MDVIASILAAASEGAGKTEIVYSSNLNFKLVAKYLELLGREGFINFINGEKKKYKTSEKGIEFLRNYKKLSEKAENLLWRKRQLQNI